VSEEHPHRYDDPAANDYWHNLLIGEDRGLNLLSRMFRAVPSPPRCKICQAPFQGPFAPVFKLVGFRRWALNQQLCRFCVSGLAKDKGGAEIPVSLLFADVRGSTTLAEQMSPKEFTNSLNRFFRVAAEAVDAEHGVPQHAVAAGKRLASDLATDSHLGTSFPAGVGVHTGVAWVGVVGEPGSLDFTVLGDTANTTARLGSAASGGELALSDEIVTAADVDTSSLERRHLDLKGKEETFDAWIEKVP
jgi:adenylate cyclase